jgi:flagellar L-ring protein FlgH
LRKKMKTDHSEKKKVSLFLISLVSVCMAGCVGPSLHQKNSENFEKEVRNASLQPPIVTEEGSLWSSGKASNIFTDVKARNVGDIVTINIVESATASKNAATKTGRTSGLEANWSGVFDSIASNWAIQGQKIGTDHKISLANNFDGSGATTRSSSMTAYITARVTQVLPNGNMVIRGTRQVQVNSENQLIFIQGIIRPEDVSSQNIILSTFVADAMIELSGRGSVSDKQNPGWAMRVVDWVWPF